MQLLCLFVAGALIGSVHCDNQCFTSVFTDCGRSTLDLDDADDMPTLCNHLKKQFYCLTEKAVRCRMGFSREAKNVSEILKQMCTKGNAINTEFERQKKCFKAAVDERKCNDPIDEILGTGETLKEMIRSNKEACKQLDSYSRCIVGSVETKCGGSNKNFFSTLFHPMITFGQAVCDQLVTPADENTKELKSVALISPFAIIPSFFIYA
ncbi:hypothetical protein AVEN_106387-1 [Araneus ventricosus]|uniref:T20D4.11-like domain-containing protein n=1 Tax=Araneus ventricosus TaxID=182803 RepID=A0A4Y2AST0_ARAVE|nr:hypothetical protein AVEN_106387-1 [Araneus ventricosus]